MLHFCGENWQVDLAVEEAHAADRQGAAALHVIQDVPPDGAQPSGQTSGSDPAAGAAFATTGAQSPGSGIERPVSEASWRSSAPGSPEILTERILKRYDPSKESLEAYKARVRRQVRALEVLGESLPSEVVEAALATGTLIQKMQNLTQDPAEQLRLLGSSPSSCWKQRRLEAPPSWRLW